MKIIRPINIEYMKFLFINLFFLISGYSFANVALVKGVIKLSNRQPAAYAVVFIEEIQKYTTTDEQGKYVLNEIPFGEHSLQVSTMGAEPLKIQIKVYKAEVIVPIGLKENKAIDLSEVTIHGKS